MAENLQPETMSTWMRGVEKRLAAVERPARLSTVQYTGTIQPNTAVTVTSGTFVTAWEFGLSLVVADAVGVWAVVTTGAGTTAEVRVRVSNLPDTPVTATATVGAGLSKGVGFDWIIPDLPLGGRGYLVQLQARRTAGAGNVFVYNPYIAMQAPSYEIDAADDGNPRVL